VPRQSCAPRGAPLAAERLPHESDRRQRLPQDQRRRYPHDAPPEPRERPIAPRIGASAPSVRAAVYFDDELCRRRGKVGDELPGDEPPDDDLPPERDPEPPPRR